MILVDLFTNKLKRRWLGGVLVLPFEILGTFMRL